MGTFPQEKIIYKSKKQNATQSVASGAVWTLNGARCISCFCYCVPVHLLSPEFLRVVWGITDKGCRTCPCRTA